MHKNRSSERRRLTPRLAALLLALALAAALAGIVPAVAQVSPVSVDGFDRSGLEVEVHGIQGFIRKTDLSRARTEQRPDRFAVGEKIDAKVTNFDKNARKLSLSVKAREIAEDKQAMEQFGSSDSGASLGDILGAALNKAKKDE